MKKALSLILAGMLCSAAAVSVSAKTFTDFEQYGSFEMGGNPVYAMEEPKDWWAGQWNGGSDNGDTITAEIKDGVGYNGSKGLAISSDGNSNVGFYLFCTADNKIPNDYTGAGYLRVWMDFTDVELRKGNFGFTDSSYSLFTTDAIDGFSSPAPYFYSADGVTWEEYEHGDDGCFGDAQSTPVYGQKGWFAFPMADFPIIGDVNWEAYDEGTLPNLADITGLYFFWDYSDNTPCVGESFIFDNIELVEDYKVFDNAPVEAPAAETPIVVTAAGEVVTDGLVAYYDGANNANGSQDKNATVWTDLSGKGHNFTVELDANNYWTDNALHVSDAYNYFDDSLVDVVSGEKYTVEIAFGEMENFGTDWVSYILSDNDAFSMFLRVAGDYVEFKSAGNARPKVEGGTDYLNNSTFTVTFDINGTIDMYIDGECIGTQPATETIVADTLFLGHTDSQRNWLGDVYSIRFYDRALSAEEVAQNAASDNAKYRGIGVVAETPVVEEPVVETSVVEEPIIEAPVVEAPVEETVEAPAPVAEAPVVTVEAPKTFDAGIIAVAAAVVSLAGYAVFKKR